MPRLFAPTWQVMAASASQLTVTAHGFVTGDKVTYDISGQTGLQTGGGTALGAGPFFVRNINANTIELYYTRANAENTAATTNRQGFTAVTTGTYGEVRTGMCHLIYSLFSIELNLQVGT